MNVQPGPMMWVVGFCPIVGRPSLLQRLLRPGYAHCWAAKLIAEDLWYWVEWTPERLIIGLSGDDLVRRASEGATEVLAFEQAPESAYPRRPILSLQHCATLTSHAIGLRPKPWATPWSFRCALLRAGAVQVRPPQEPRDEVPQGPHPQPSRA